MEFLNYKTDIPSIVLLTIESITLLFLILYYGLVYLRLSFYKEKKKNEGTLEPVSVIVCTKDDYAVLKEKLFYLMEQEYPEYEVVVINHASQDETEYLLKVFGETYPHLKVVNLCNDVNPFNGKKFPLSIGIKSAKYDLLLLTEPDCMPNGYRWIENMQNHFIDQTQVVLGFSMYENKKTFLNKLLQYDTLRSVASYFTFAIMGRPYMGSGRNLAYRKSFFFEQNGFINHYHIREGADSLFVNQNATKNNTNIAIDKESFTISAPKTRFKDWFAEKKNFFGVRKSFKTSDKVLLNLYPISLLLFWSAFVGLLVNGFPWEIIVSVFFIKIAWQIFCFYKLLMRFYEKRKMFIFAPLFEILFFFIDASMILLSVTYQKGNNRWK